MKLTRVKEPTFKVNRTKLNLTELWVLRLQVVQGIMPSDIKVTDQKGKVAYILEDGSLSDNIYGLSNISYIKYLITQANKTNTTESVKITIEDFGFEEG